MTLERSKTNEENQSTTSSSGVGRIIGCWKQRTWPEKLLFFVLVGLMIGFSVAMTILVEVYFRLEDRLMLITPQLRSAAVTDDSVYNLTQNKEVCLSVECIEAAARILTSIDPLADPCDDMAKFACGGWTRRAIETPNAKDVVMVLENLQMRVDHQIKLLLESPPMPGDLKGYGKVRSYFHSCMTEGDDSRRLASVRRVMAELGQFIPPAAVSNQTEKSSRELTELLNHLIQFNGAPLFDISTQVDDRNASRFVLSISLPRQSGVLPQFYSTIPKDLLVVASKMGQGNDKEKKSDQSRIKRQLHNLLSPTAGEHQQEEWPHDPTMPFPMNPEDFDLFQQSNGSFLASVQQISREQKTIAALRMLRDIGAFSAFDPEEYMIEEKAIQRWINQIDQLIPSDRDRKLKLQSAQILNYFTVDQLQEQFNFVNWTKLLINTVGEKAVINDVVVHYPELLEEIHYIVENTTDKRLVQNSILVLAARDVLLELFKPPPGIEKWQFCLQATKGGFGELLSGLYMQQFKPAELMTFKTKAEEMFESLKLSIVESIEATEWLDPISRSRVLSKAKNLRSNLVSAEMFTNATFLENMVAEVQIDNLDFVEATWKLYQLFRRDFFQIYSKPVDPTTVTWQLLAYPIIANAFYLQHFNSMVLPLALLNDPLFSMETPSYLGLGTLGFIVAHEIMHGFDNSGIEFDESGARSHLLTLESQQQFKAKMECISSQYSDSFKKEFYSQNGSSITTRVDGKLTLNENVADLGAIKAIVKTQQRWARQKGSPVFLPGVNYSPEQIMLINAAQAYCALITPQAYAMIIGMDEHTPPHDRVNGFLMNLPDYGRIFNCPAGSRLNPLEKCSVW